MGWPAPGLARLVVEGNQSVSRIAIIALVVFLVTTRPVPVGNLTLPPRLLWQQTFNGEPYQGCWHPGLSRNIGIVERAC
jgi:hypothetical protein